MLAGRLVGPRPAIRGQREVGSHLRAKVGRWSGDDVRFHFRWLSDGRTIRGETGRSLKLTDDLARTRVQVRVRVTQPGYRAVQIVSVARWIRR